MDRTIEIYLLKEKTEYDEIGQPVDTVTDKRLVFAQYRSIARAEWFEAGRNGFNPNITFVVNAFDYHGESIVQWNGSLYGVYRTYIARNEKVELYCEKKGGLQGGTEES